MTTEVLTVQVNEKGTLVVKRNIDSIGKSALGAGGAVKLLQRTIALLAASQLVRSLVQLSDTFTNIENRLRTVTNSEQELTQVTQALFEVANKTRQSFEGTAEVYARIGLAAKDLGVNQKQLVQFTESLNQAVALSGASATEAQAGLIQLSQGLASGALRGDELRSVLEQLPVVADVISKELGVTRGRLRELGQEGKITAEIVLNAFKNAREELDERFAKSVPTIGQAFQVLRNDVIKLVGDFNTNTGAAGEFAKAILFVANNIQILAKAAVAAGAALLVAFGPTITAKLVAGVNLLTASITRLWALMAANPFVALASGIALVTTALFEMNKSVMDQEERVANAIHETALAKLRARRKEILDAKAGGPQDETFNALIKGLKEETELLKLSNDEREIQVALKKAEQDLGKGATKEKLAQIEALLRENQALADQDHLLKEINARVEEREKKDITKVVPRLDESKTGDNSAIGVLGIVNDEVEQTELALGQVQEQFDLTANVAQSAFGNAFGALEGFIKGAQVSWQEFARTVLSDLAVIAAKALIFQSLQGIGAGGLLKFLPGHQHGADFKVGGSGGPDSQLVAFRASPNERVTVTPPGQQAAAASPAPVDIKNVIVVDPKMMVEAMKSRPGQQVILSAVQANPQQIKRVLG